MRRTAVLSCVFLAIALGAVAKEKPRETMVFTKPELTVADHPGLVLRISEPFLRYAAEDVQHTGKPEFVMVLEVNNKSQEFISWISCDVRLYDKAGKIIKDFGVSYAPYDLQPNAGNVVKPGYRGLQTTFVTLDGSVYEDYGKIDFKVSKVKTASASLTDKPVFPEKGLVFSGYPDMEFTLSKPYVVLDGLSGDERFAIAMQFKNKEARRVQAIYFKVRVFDADGLVSESEVEEHLYKYNGPDPTTSLPFPPGFTGVNPVFYTNELSFMKTFQKIEIELVRIE